MGTMQDPDGFTPAQRRGIDDRLIQLRTPPPTSLGPARRAVIPRTHGERVALLRLRLLVRAESFRAAPPPMDR